MKARVIPRRPLIGSKADEAAQSREGMELTSASPEEKRERLYRAIERTQKLMHKRLPPEETIEALRRWFPEPRFFIESSRRVMEKTGLSRMDAFYYSLIPNLTRTTLSQQWGDSPDLGTLSRMAAYLQTMYVGIHVECFYLIMLNQRGRLIRPVLLQKGAVDRAPFYLRQVLSTALFEGAGHIVLAHNHPGGTRSPSQEDLYCTLCALNAAAPLRMPLLDHIIVVNDGAVSIREMGVIPDLLWNAVAGDSRLARNWLDVELLTRLDDPKS